MKVTEERIIRHRRGLARFDLPEIWRYRELFFFLAWRDLLIRYKQTLIGVAWAILEPVLATVILVLVFGRIARLSDFGVPYALLTFSAMVPWQFVASTLTTSGQSLVGNASIITKVYFPRIIIPASVVVSNLVDFFIGLGILFGLFLWYHAPVTLRVLWLPFFFMPAIATALGAGMWFSALNVKYRDVKYMVPFLVRIGMYVSPVGFASSLVPDPWRFWYYANPLVGTIDGFRWALLGDAFPIYGPGMGLSVAVSLLLLVSGLWYFRSTEKTFADII